MVRAGAVALAVVEALGAGVGALGTEEGAGAGTLAPPAAAAWANAATGGGDLLQSGCGGVGTGCPVVGLTTSGH